MTTATKTSIRLICPDCRFENEVERIYCHACGARLDRSAEAAKRLPRVEKPEETLARVRSMFDQRRARIRAFAMKTAKTMALAAVTAGAVLLVLPPDIPSVAPSAVLPPQISLDLEMLITYHRPAVLRYAEDDVNRFLTSKLKTRKDKLSYPLVDFQRVHFAFLEGSCRVAVERSIFGYPIFTVETFRVQVKDGRILVTPISGAIGRAPIHPELMKYAGFLFEDVAGELHREDKLISRVGAIEFSDKEVSFLPPL